MRTRQELEEIEHVTLAPYAQKSSESAGRKHLERAHPLRTAYQRDRARIIHSKAFRRLEYKTQVFLSGTGDHLRNRLTHTIEVASVSRTIARSLGLNEDLAESIALAHDLGHSPFGHCGEETLSELMRDHGGFEHNEQSLRIVQTLECKYPRFPGLNLSEEVLEGLRKHERFHESPLHPGQKNPSPSLEAQIANLADEITYYSHDLDDGLEHNLLDLAQLQKVEIWAEAYEAARKQFPKMRVKDLCSYVIRCIIDAQVEDVVQTSEAHIRAAGVRSADEVRRQKKPLIRYSDALLKKNKKLRKFLYANLYYHPAVSGANRGACKMMSDVFQVYVENPDMLGSVTSRRVPKEGLYRAVCDYVSGMTDRFLAEKHRELFPLKVGRKVPRALRLPTRVHE